MDQVIDLLLLFGDKAFELLDDLFFGENLGGFILISFCDHLAITGLYWWFAIVNIAFVDFNYWGFRKRVLLIFSSLDGNL